MKCLGKYKWIKLYRAALPQGKGIMVGSTCRQGCLSARKGPILRAHKRCNTGNIVGLKSILGVKRRSQALQIMDELQSLGYISYNLEAGTKKLSYEIADWVQKCSGSESDSGTVYATEGYGFICTPRAITNRLVLGKRTFDESDAWLDLTAA